MTLGINEIADSLKVKLTARRGAHFDEKFELYENASASSGTVVQGDPVDLSAYNGLVASGRIAGTDAQLFVRPTLRDPGDTNRAARIQLFVDQGAMESCFADGALAQFTIEVLATRPSTRLPVLSLTVRVRDTAFGATR